jgi:hypothetical protein
MHENLFEGQFCKKNQNITDGRQIIGIKLNCDRINWKKLLKPRALGSLAGA